MHLVTTSTPFRKKRLHKYASGYYEQTVAQQDPTQICTWLLRANRSTKRHYTNMHLVTMGKPLHKKTLHKYAPGYYEQTAPQTETTQICSWLLCAKHATKRHDTNMHLFTTIKTIHKKTRHK